MTLNPILRTVEAMASGATRKPIGMGKRNPGRRHAALSTRFEEAERSGLWLHPKNQAERLALSRGAASGAYTTPLRGWYARTQHYDRCSARERALRRIRSLASQHPSWTFCLFSAAVLHGLQVPQALLGETHIIGPSTSSTKKPLAIRHTYQVDENDLVIRLGVPVTSLRRTVVDCMCATTFRYGLAIADSALRWGNIEKHALASYLECAGARRKGVAMARTALAYADGRSENGGESIARAAMIELGFTVPELQVAIVDPLEPNNIKRADFGWKLPDGRWIIGELDGLTKYLNKAQEVGSIHGAVKALSKERIRESHINLTGATVVRFTYEQVLDTAYFEQLLLTAGVPKRDGPDARIT